MPFAGAPVDLADGYIHLSTAAQLTETVDKHFAGQDDLWVAAIDLEALGGAVRWEESRGGALFPHIYGAMPLEVVIAYGPLERDSDGTVKLPCGYGMRSTTSAPWPSSRSSIVRWQWCASRSKHSKADLFSAASVAHLCRFGLRFGQFELAGIDGFHRSPVPLLRRVPTEFGRAECLQWT